MSTEDIYRHQGLGQTSGIGNRCGLVLVDFVNGFVDADILGGPMIEAAAQATVPLLAAFRRAGLPVAHTRVVFADDGSDHNVFCLKCPPLKGLTETAPSSQIVPALTPAAGELVVRKRSASAFFQTGLADWLRLRGVDTAIITGCTTSGCVRASVIDALQHDFRTLVVEECVADRAQAPHEANLFDMRQKYADIVRRDAIISHVASLTPTTSKD
jgi:maleamate amidohydrolase